MRRIHIRPRRPKWSLKSSFLVGIGLAAAITPLVLLIVHRSIWQELEIVTGILSLLMFVYLSVVLYLGVRFDKAEGFSVDWPQSHPKDILGSLDLPTPDSGGFFTEAGAEAGVLGLVVGIVLDILVSLLLAALIAVLIWVGLNAAVAVVLAVFLPLFYFYRRSLRYLVARGRRCRGRWGRSLLYGAGATLVYTVWFYLIFSAAQQISVWKLG